MTPKRSIYKNPPKQRNTNEYLNQAMLKCGQQVMLINSEKSRKSGKELMEIALRNTEIWKARAMCRAEMIKLGIACEQPTTD